MAQAATKKSTFKKVLASGDFRRGFEEAKKGKPFKADDKASWDYERGRQFAFCFNGQLKQGRNVTISALYAFANAFHNGSII